jgi:hypothetical protein
MHCLPLSVTDKGTFWNFTIIEDKFACITSSHPELIKLLMRRKAFERFLDDERSDTLGPSLRSCLGVND